MNVQVRFFTRSGNTEKLARAIGEAVGVEPESIAVPLSEKADVLFLGTSYYAFDADPAVKEFVLANKENIGRLICFGTSAMMKSMYKPMKKVADKAGVPLEKEDFHCRGEWWRCHPGRPDANDLEAARAFAKKFTRAIGP